MWRALALLLALLPTLAQAQWRPTDRRHCRHGGRSRMCQSVGQAGGGAFPAPLFSLLPTNGNGAPVMSPQTVCTDFAAELVGQYVCMRGDGTSVNGPGITLTKSGAVTTTTPRICPNGADCDAQPVQSFDGIGAWTANQSAPPAGDFSMCGLWRVRTEKQNSSSLRLSANTFIQTAFAADPSLGTFQIGATAIPNTTIPLPGAWSFICATYQRVGGASNNVARFYVNGTAGQTSSAMPLVAGTAFPFEAVSTNASFSQDIALALYTEKVLSPATIAAMSAKVFGTFTAADGLTATGYQRTSVATCVGPDGLLTVLPSLRPCINTQGGLFAGPAVEVEPARTNAVIKSQELDTWSQAGATTTANTTTAPDSTLTAETITATATTGDHAVYRTITTAAGAQHVISAFFKANTGVNFAGFKYQTDYPATCNLTTGEVTMGLSPAGATGTCKILANGWKRFTVVIPSASTIANPVVSLQMFKTALPAVFTATGTESIFAWGGQLEVTGEAYSTGYIRTDGTATTRIKGQFNSPYVSGMTDTTGCIGMTATVMPGVASFRMMAPDSNLGAVSPANTSDARCGDGTSNTLVTTGVNYRVAPLKFSCEWEGAALTARSGALSATTAYDGTFLGPTWTLGSKDTNGNAVVAHGFVGNLLMGAKINACR